MKQVATLLLVITPFAATFAAEPADRVREAALGWTQGAVKQDAAALSRFLAGDLQYAHAGGQAQTKEEYIAAVTLGPARYESFIFSDLKILFYGKAAVLTGFCDVKMVGRDAFRVRCSGGRRVRRWPLWREAEPMSCTAPCFTHIATR